MKLTNLQIRESDGHLILNWGHRILLIVYVLAMTLPSPSPTGGVGLIQSAVELRQWIPALPLCRCTSYRPAPHELLSSNVARRRIYVYIWRCPSWLCDRILTTYKQSLRDIGAIKSYHFEHKQTVKMPSATQSITIEPLTVQKDSQVNFGAVVSNVDIENLTGKTFV